jgi:hypothetical protein
MLVCTECGLEIPEISKYLAAQFSGNPCKLGFFWACEHYPAVNAPVRLASRKCVESFCERHPEYVNAVVELMGGYTNQCQHTLVN